jgi:hypothetical protein
MHRTILKMQPILGSEVECTKMMNTIEKNSKSGDTDMVQGKEKDQHKLQSTITIERKEPEDMAVDEEEEENENQQSLHISDEEENEHALTSNQPSTTQNSTSMFCFCSSKYLIIHI